MDAASAFTSATSPMLVLFGTRGTDVRTLAPGRRQVNLLATRKREHSRKPDELYPIIEGCSWGPYLELFARNSRDNWHQWGNECTARPESENPVAESSELFEASV